MKSQFFPLATAIGLGLSLAACSGTGSRIEGNQCKKGYEPIQMNIPAQAKLQMHDSTLPDGEYRVIRSALHFKGDPTEKHPDGFQVMLKDDAPAAAKDSTPTVRADCFRNSNVDQPYAASVPELTSLVIKDGHVVNSTTKNLGFTMSEDGQFETLSAPVERKLEGTQDLFNGSDETFVMRYNDFDFEIRTKGRATNGEYTMMSYLHRVN